MSTAVATSREPTSDDLSEAERLEAVERLGILDTPPDPAFDTIARLARTTLGAATALVSLIDAHRQWVLACDGAERGEVPRRDSFCRRTILRSGPLIVLDALADPRFADNPFVTGEPYLRFYAGVPLVTRDGHAIGTLCVHDPRPRTDFSEEHLAMLLDLAALTMIQIELREVAGTDPLTGLLSRRAFQEPAARAVAVAQRQRYDLSCIAFDIDHFKSVNDRFGHAGGDRVLVGAAEAWSSVLRETDIFGRIGGEEFAAVVHAGRRDALVLAERLRAALAEKPFEMDGKTLKVTASFGVATLDRMTDGFDALLARADAALYEAKNAGRDRCVASIAPGSGQITTRRRVFKAGQIQFFNRNSTVDCTIRSLGDDGAGLDVSSTAGIPETFTLLVRADGIEHRARIVSRTDRSLDVEFLRPSASTSL